MTGDLERMKLEAFSERPVIGRPIANTRVYVLDGNLQPCGTGVPGELCVGGLCLALGYTDAGIRDKFVEDPFREGEWIYRTGDRVRYLSGGQIEFLDRKDNQVKINGYRVELMEIDAVLRAAADTPEVAAIPWPVSATRNVFLPRWPGWASFAKPIRFPIITAIPPPIWLSRGMACC